MGGGWHPEPRASNGQYRNPTQTPNPYYAPLPSPRPGPSYQHPPPGFASTPAQSVQLSPYPGYASAPSNAWQVPSPMPSFSPNMTPRPLPPVDGGFGSQTSIVRGHGTPVSKAKDSKAGYYHSNPHTPKQLFAKPVVKRADSSMSGTTAVSYGDWGSSTATLPTSQRQNKGKDRKVSIPHVGRRSRRVRKESWDTSLQDSLRYEGGPRFGPF